MVNKEDILKIVQMRGPIIPNELKKILKAGDTILLGALLSELNIAGKVKVTHTKVGSGPAYYTPGSEEKLQNLIKYLNEKDRKTAELLREKKILKDSDQSPLVRVSLRNIKDFAKPLEVIVKGQREIFWKWHMLPIKDAQDMIVKRFKPERRVEKPIVKPAPVVKPQIIVTQEVKPEDKPTTATESKKDSEPTKAEPLNAKGKPLSTAAKPQKPKPEVKKEKIEVQQELGIPQEELEKEKDPLFKKTLNYCNKNEIQVIEYKIIRKKSEIDFILAVPSRIGSQEYYCKAKKKKKINDGDLSSAYIHGQANKLPVIFITTGEMTKKAKEMLSKDFKGMVVKKI